MEGLRVSVSKEQRQRQRWIELRRKATPKQERREGFVFCARVGETTKRDVPRPVPHLLSSAPSSHLIVAKSGTFFPFSVLHFHPRSESVCAASVISCDFDVLVFELNPLFVCLCAVW